MSEGEYLTNLKEGAEAYLHNVWRLLDDAQALLERRSYLSCFVLAIDLRGTGQGIQND